MSRPVQYTYADSSQVRQTANGRYQYTATGRFSPTKNGRPLAPGFRKDSRGRVYDVARRREVARSNFGLGPAPTPRPKVRSRVRAAGLYLAVAPNIYTTRPAAEIEPEAMEAIEAIAQQMRPGMGPVYSHYYTTVARWAEDWTSFVVAFATYNAGSTARISASTGITDQPSAAAMNAEQLAMRKKYIALDPNLGDEIDEIETVAIVVPIRAGR